MPIAITLSLSLSRRLGTKGRKFPGNVPPANYHCSPWPRPPTPSSSNYSYGSPRLINDTANRARYRVPRIISVAVSRGCCIIPRATCPRKVSITRPPPSFFPQISLSLSPPKGGQHSKDTVRASLSRLSSRVNFYVAILATFSQLGDTTD